MVLRVKGCLRFSLELDFRLGLRKGLGMAFISVMVEVRVRGWVKSHNWVRNKLGLTAQKDLIVFTVVLIVII